jgi:transcriptional antiterminator NusG
MDTKWYVIRAVAGKEKKAIEQLQFEIEQKGFGNKVKQIVIPMERIYHVRNGKKVATERNHYPGYILIETDPTIIGELSGLHKIVNFITGFLGGDKPTPLKQSEVERILGQMDILASSDEKFADHYAVGESVKIIDGPFNGFVGNIQEFNDDKKRLKIDVKVFGRSTPLELGYTQVQKSY